MGEQQVKGDMQLRRVMDWQWPAGCLMSLSELTCQQTIQDMMTSNGYLPDVQSLVQAISKLHREISPK